MVSSPEPRGLHRPPPRKKRPSTLPSPRPSLPLLAAFLVPLAVVCALCWPLPLHPASTWNPSLFGASHAWMGDHLWRALTQGESLHHTLRAGYPWERGGRFIGWLPLLACLPLRPVLGPIASFHAGLLLALPISSIAAWPLLRRWSGAGPWAAAAGCVAFALCPFALGTLSSGELPKLCIGLIPLFLYALDRARSQERGWHWAAASAGLAMVTGFTSPYFGLTLPLLTIGLLGWDVWTRRRLLRPVLCGGAVAAGLVPVALYFSGIRQHVSASLYMPAQNFGRQNPLPSPHPSASLQDLLLGLPADHGSPWDMRHVAYLGSLLLVVLAVLAWRQRDGRAGRWAAGALLATGGLLALGPWLYPIERLLPVPLPAVVLAMIRYPLATGGMFYRLAVLGSLGLALWLAVECARRPRLAWLLLLVQVGDGLRSSAPWPLEVFPIPGVEALEELQGDDGAVLDLPYGGGLVPSQHALLLAAVHGHPTTALPRMFLPSEQAMLRRLWSRALAEDDAPAALRALGIRYVLCQNGDARLEAETSASLGEPILDDEPLMIWDLGPTQLVPRSAEQLEHKGQPRHGEGARKRPPRGKPPGEPPRHQGE